MYETPIFSTGSFWGTIYAVTRGVRLIRVIYRPDGTFKNRYVLDNRGDQAIRAIAEWFDRHPQGNLRAFVTAYYVVIDAIRQAERQATPEVAARG